MSKKTKIIIICIATVLLIASIAVCLILNHQ